MAATVTRSYDRAPDVMRPVTIEPGFMRTASGSALISMGETRVICTASAQTGVPRWRMGKGLGWVTAEYGMLPASTGERKQRDVTKGRADGRTVEIQRLIGRSLRAVVDLADRNFNGVMPEDLVQFGLIPEFIGRLPVISAVHHLQREDLVKILLEPKNALVRQYQRFFKFDKIDLVFKDEALWAIADKALARDTGARGLRSIIEETLLDVQFELPSRRDVKKCVVTKETIEKGLTPTLVTEAVEDDGPDDAAAAESA